MPRLGNKLRKVAKPPVITIKPFELRTGTRNSLGEPSMFKSEADLRAAATKALRDWVPWCERHNKDGIDSLAASVGLVESRFAGFKLGDDPKRIECEFDDFSGMHIVLQARRIL